MQIHDDFIIRIVYDSGTVWYWGRERKGKKDPSVKGWNRIIWARQERDSLEKYQRKFRSIHIIRRSYRLEES